MKKRKLEINTKRLNLYLLSDEEIEELIKTSEDLDLKAAYQEMLDGCKNDPENRSWYAPWTMELKKTKEKIGDLGFKGPQIENAVEIGYGINKEYEGQGYTSEAVVALVDYALDSEDVYFVEAEADEQNLASIHILEKLGFKKYGQGLEGPRFVKEKDPGSFTSIGMSIGMCFGLSIGMLLFDSMVIGMSIGLAIGAGLGAAKDKEAKKKMDIARSNKYGIPLDTQEDE